MPVAVLGLMGLLSLSESEANPAPTGAVSIDRRDMINWLADGEHGVWVQAGNSSWFYARFADVCPGLRSSNSLVFDTGASNRIDHTTSVILPSQRRCKVQAVVPSRGPPENRNATVVLQPQTQ